MRNRTGTRYVPITISLKPSMIDEIETVLKPKQSRSKWIAKAIEEKLSSGELDLEDVPLNELFAELEYRRAIPNAIRWQLQNAFMNKSESSRGASSQV